jgi:hypothetical protein
MIWGIMAQELFALGHGNNRRRVGSSLRQGSPRWSGGRVGTRILTPEPHFCLATRIPPRITATNRAASFTKSLSARTA